MPVNNVSLNSPADFTVAQQQIERQRKMAEMLQQESMQQDQGQMVSGWYVPTSPTQHLAKLLQGYVSGKTTEAADQRQKDLVTQKQQYSQGVLDQFTHDTTPRPLGDNEVGARYTPTASDVNSATARMLMGLGGDPAQSAALLAQNAQKNAEDAKYAQLFAPPAGMTQQQATNAALTYGAQNGQAGATPMAAEMQEQLMRSKPFNPMNPNGLPTQIAIEAYRKDPAKYAETYLNPEYSTTPQYDQNGRAYVLNKRGEPKYLDGVTARDKMEVSAGGEVFNPYKVQPGQRFNNFTYKDTNDGRNIVTSRVDANAGINEPVKTTPLKQTLESIAGNNVTMRGQNMSQQTAQRGQDMVDARSKEQNANGKAPTEFQGKSAAFGARAEQSNAILNDLEKKGVMHKGIWRTGLGSVPFVGDGLDSVMNAAPTFLGGSNENQQKNAQARRDFVNAILRQESGAAIGASEFENAERQYFPQIGDSPQVVLQKAQTRMTAIEGLKRNAGKAAFSAPTGATGGWSITRE